MNRIHHQLQSGIDETAGFFGIEVFDESSGAFEVSEESGDSLALAVAGTARCQRGLLSANLLRQMRGSPASGVRSPEARRIESSGARGWGLGT